MRHLFICIEYCFSLICMKISFEKTHYLSDRLKLSTEISSSGCGQGENERLIYFLAFLLSSILNIILFFYDVYQTNESNIYYSIQSCIDRQINDFVC